MKTATITITLFVTLFLTSFISLNFFSEPTPYQAPTPVLDFAADLNFIENKNQWNPAIEYAVALGDLNYLFLEENTLTYTLLAEKESSELHDIMRESDEVRAQHFVPGHAYKVHFLNSLKPKLTGQYQREAYNNYFLGNDPQKWAKEVPVFRGVTYDNLYNGVSMVAYSDNRNFKYDFIVAPNADPSQIQLAYEGVDDIYLKGEDLIIETSVRDITELRPYVYQTIDGIKTTIESKYVLKNNILTFEFPNSYNKSLPLIIDPTVIVATLSGTTGPDQGNFGHTATYDNAGNIYTGGISFGTGYPFTIGAFQTNYAGGSTDIAVTKYNPDGSDLLYATYIGGNDEDYPHSIIVDFNGQLCILGDSDSNNYPTTSNAVQPIHGGDHDIVITKLNSTGSALIGSTYLGGDNSDGQNESPINANYGDRFRGEIILDAQGNIYIASCSYSENFPTTSFAIQPTKNNEGFITQDGVVAKLNGDVSTMYWSTFLGGENADMCFGLRVDDFGAVYVTGYAGGQDFPMVSGGVQPTWPGGDENAYVLKLSPDGSSIMNGTFWGSDGDEHGYFIDIDESNQIHIYGTTTGDMPITPNTYFFNEGSNQFITAFSNNLNTIIYSTVIGLAAGSDPDFVPVAFMVDKCDGIYFSGYYGESGLPTTPDAISTVGDAMYLGVLEKNAAALSFATYYGESNHVDGGTSRFDKGGLVYQAVCSCSWNGTVMNTTSNAWATSQTTDCDVGVFKIDFEIETVTASALALPSTSGCAPYTVDFVYTGEDAETIFWDFGTGNSNTSTQFNPTFTFTEAGSYRVLQAVAGPNSCNGVDSFYLTIDVLDGNSSFLDTTICFGQNSLFLDASTANATYTWSNGWTGAGLEVTSGGLIWVDTKIPGCSQRDSFFVEAGLPPTVVFEANNPECFDDLYGNIDVITGLSGDVEFAWNNGMTTGELDNLLPGFYQVTVTNEVGCGQVNSFEIVVPDPIAYDLIFENVVCAGEGNGFIDFQNITGGTPPFEFGFVDEPLTDNSLIDNLSGGTYEVVISDANGCQEFETIEIEEPEGIWIEAGADQMINLGETTDLDGIISNSEGQEIEWSPANSLTCPTCQETEATPYKTTTYVFSVSNPDFGCVLKDSLIVFVDETRNVFIPNIFSPNADGYNDMFYVSTDVSVARIKSIIIFDRWGSTIYEDENFQPNDPRFGWDGTFKNRKMGDQVFVYAIDVEFVDGKTELFKGDITLIN